MTNISRQFEHVYNVISSRHFLNMEAIGGEVPFYISAYDVKDEVEISKSIGALKNRLEVNGIKVLEINLYDIAIYLLEQNLGLEKFFKIEERKSKEKLKKAIQSSLNIHQVFMPHIEKIINESGAQVYFLTGIGAVFPYIRSHNILNNLQNIAKAAPTVMFFPGVYNGLSLELFSKLTDDNYYRAFNIDSIKE